jgi:hypothetical protein
LDNIVERDKDDVYDSDGSDIMGAMRRGMISPPERLSPSLNLEWEDDLMMEDITTLRTPEETVAGQDDNALDRRPFALNRSELVSLILHDMAVQYKAPRAYLQDQCRLFSTVGVKILDYRTVRKRVCNMTGLREVLYDRCPASCMSYAMYPDLDTCLNSDCQQSRWKDTEMKIPHAQHSYLPVTQRLLLWWNNASRAQTMISYRNSFEQLASPVPHDRRDFWSGTLFKKLREQGLFGQETDLAFALSSDGVKVSSGFPMFSTVFPY